MNKGQVVYKSVMEAIIIAKEAVVDFFDKLDKLPPAPDFKTKMQSKCKFNL